VDLVAVGDVPMSSKNIAQNQIVGAYCTHPVTRALQLDVYKREGQERDDYERKEGRDKERTGKMEKWK